MQDDETGRADKRGSAFCTTRWSLVVLASGDDPDADRALHELCEIYWPPLYAYARRSGKSVEDAQDLTQEFLHHMLDTGNFGRADHGQGKFRSYLLSCFKNLMVDRWRRSKRQKRGGDAVVISIDEQDPETGYQLELHDELSPEKLYDRRWAETLVDRSLHRLKAEWEAGGRPFEKLKVYLMEPRGAVPYSEMAAEMGTTESALKTSVHRLRHRYGEVFREEVRETVADPEEVEGEIRYLISMLSG